MNIEATAVAVEKQFIFKIKYSAVFWHCCDSLSRIVARDLYWLLWLLQYEALIGYYARICFKIATVNQCMNKIIGRNKEKMTGPLVAILWKCGQFIKSLQVIFLFFIPFNFSLLFCSFIFGLTKNRLSIFDILPAKHV